MAELGGKGEVRERIVGGVMAEEMGFEGEIGGEIERGARKNGF
ncbi:hypothetical protein TIFTF001_021804 [Ficus carica]|uniref:Uncharacterized protein n=1 Tax=Ficus carica TaxID=3494 RepID=A0AA88AL09_FICCA|nr:hypothetical protein TIFTF001_021804 [Ficus carica]